MGCALLGLVFWDAVVRADDPAAALQQAVDEYRGALDCPDRDERLERFQRAQLMFAELVEDGEDPSAGGVRNASLQVNLGNAALGAEQLGPAVLAYRRALLFDPERAQGARTSSMREACCRSGCRVPILRHCWALSFANRALVERPAAPDRCLAVPGLALLIAASIRWQHRGLRALAWLPAIGWLLVMLTLLMARWQLDRDQGVVVADEVIARSADSPHAPPRFSQPLPGGTEVQLLEQREGWSRIQLADSREAWVPTSAVRPITAP